MSSPIPRRLRFPLTGLWRHPDFVKLWTGQTVSAVGSYVTEIALPLTAVLVLRASPAQVGLLAALGATPALLVGLAAGVWVDRLPRRHILIAADLGRSAALAAIPVAALLGLLRMELLYAVALVHGTMTVFAQIANSAYLPALLPRDRLAEGNSKLGMSDSVAEIAGPPLGGVLVQWLTAPLAITVDVFSFLCSALSVWLVRAREPAAPGGREMGGARSEVGEGLRLVLSDRILRALAAHGATFNFFGSFIGALYTIYLIRVLHLAPAMVGALVGLGGVGALVGALLAGRVMLQAGLARTVGGAFLLAVGLETLMPLAGWMPDAAVPLLAAAQLLGDVWMAVYFIAELTLRQTIIPDRLLGRANATMHVVTRGAQPFGALVGGLLGMAIGVRPTLTIAVAGMLLGACWLLPLRGRSTSAPPADVVA